MQALSFAVHIPLVCFGIAFPAFVVFAEWLHLRTGDEIYRVLARRWSKVMLALFAVGVVTGTILSFELGLLWPNFMATFGDVFGLGFAIEGISFFVEAIFIGIYVYGWDRLSPRAHLLTGIPIIISGFTGSLMVIAVNGWMNHPTGFTLKDGRAVDVHPFEALFENGYFWHELIHMYIAGYIVAGFLTAGVYAWALLRGRRTRYNRTALIIPLTFAALACARSRSSSATGRRARSPRRSRSSSPRSRGSRRPRRARPSTCSAGTTATGRVRDRDPKLLSLLAYHDPNAKVQGLDTVPADERPPVNVVRFAFQTMVGHRLRARAARRRVRGVLAAAAAPAGTRRGSTARSWPPGRCPSSRCWPAGSRPRSGRQPWVVYGVMRTEEAVTGRERHPGRLRDARARLRGSRCRGRVDAAAPRARADRAARAGGARGGEEPWSLAEAPVVLMLVGLAAYAVLAGADFGAGFWQLLGGRGERDRALREHAHHAMGPVWEANHVWLIFVLVVCWTAYPTAFGSIASTLAVPLFVAGIGIILRGTAYALRSGAAALRERRAIEVAFAASSILTPFALGAVIGGIASGRVPVGNARGRPRHELAQPDVDRLGAIAVATAAYLAAVYLAADAVRIGRPELERAFRERALGMAVVAGAAALAGLVVVHSDAEPIWDGLTSGAGLAAVIVSALAGAATILFVLRRRYEPARVTARDRRRRDHRGLGTGAAPAVPARADDRGGGGRAAMLIATLVALGLGALILVPSLGLLFSLLLRGRFDEAAGAARPRHVRRGRLPRMRRCCPPRASASSSASSRPSPWSRLGTHSSASPACSPSSPSASWRSRPR